MEQVMQIEPTPPHMLTVRSRTPDGSDNLRFTNRYERTTMNSLSHLRSRLTRAGILFAASLVTIPASAHGQVTPQAVHTPAVRLPSEISSSQRTSLMETLPSVAHRTGDTGRLSGSKELHGISMAFSRNAEQRKT